MSKTPTKQAGKRKAFSYAEARGVQEFNCDDVQLLVHAPIDAVTSAWAKAMGAKRTQRDVLGQTVTISRSTHLLVQLKGHPWTIIAACVFNPGNMLGPANAKAIAKSAATKAISYVSSDTAGICEYELFNAAGKSVERFRMSDSIEFRSEARKVRAPALGSESLPFVNDFFRDQDAFAPACRMEFGVGLMKPGIVIELGAFDQIPADAVERMDLVEK
jgi:hypothetical protein